MCAQADMSHGPSQGLRAALRRFDEIIKKTKKEDEHSIVSSLLPRQHKTVIECREL